MSDGSAAAARDPGGVSWVRARGLLPSLGAAGSLVAAGAALWLLAAMLLGVRVWPGGPGGGSGRLTLPATTAAAPRVAPAAVPRRVAVARPRIAGSLPARHRAARPARRRRPAKGLPATPRP